MPERPENHQSFLYRLLLTRMNERSLNNCVLRTKKALRLQPVSANDRMELPGHYVHGQEVNDMRLKFLTMNDNLKQ